MIASVDIGIMELLAQEVGYLVGGTDDARIFPQYAPERSKLPYIVVSLISADQTQPLGGPITYRETRMQIDGFAEGYAELRTIARGVFDAITQIQNPTDIPIGAERYRIYCGRLENDFTEIVEPKNASDKAVRRFIHEYSIHHQN